MTADGAERLGRLGMWVLFGALIALVAVNLPELGADPWPFRSGPVHSHGVLGPLVRAADGHWDLGISRTAAFLGGLVVALVAAASWRARSWPRWAGVVLVVVVVGSLSVVPTLLQVGLRDSTRPWFHTNDSTYQIEIAGQLIRNGEDPYGHNYRGSGLERFYSYNGSVKPEALRREPALTHFAYFPGAALTGAAWGALPSPFDDYRVLVLLTTIGLIAAAMSFRAPLSWKLVLGALLAGNPIAVRSAWFGQNDAPAILFMVLAFGLLTRARFGWAAASLAAAVLLKQFALVAVPFFVVMLLVMHVDRAALKRAAGAFAGVLVVGILPFFIADPGGFLDDAVVYGAGTYRIVGYGLSALLIHLHVLDDRYGPYPFVWLALLVWLPITIWLLLNQFRSREVWLGAAAFTISMFVLLWLGRTFNQPYMLWPLAGVLLTALMVGAERAGLGASARGEPARESGAP
jgi:glycosyl transferase family 87